MAQPKYIGKLYGDKAELKKRVSHLKSLLEVVRDALGSYIHNFENENLCPGSHCDPCANNAGNLKELESVLDSLNEDEE